MMPYYPAEAIAGAWSSIWTWHNQSLLVVADNSGLCVLVSCSTKSSIPRPPLSQVLQ